MNLIINNECHSVLSPSTLLELIGSINLGEKKGLAVAINQSIIPRNAWESRLLEENDSITIIQATQGG
jgi:sulfur carrier protein